MSGEPEFLPDDVSDLSSVERTRAYANEELPSFAAHTIQQVKLHGKISDKLKALDWLSEVTELKKRQVDPHANRPVVQVTYITSPTGRVEMATTVQPVVDEAPFGTLDVDAARALPQGTDSHDDLIEEVPYTMKPAQAVSDLLAALDRENFGA